MTQPNTQAPAEQWKVGNEFAPYHPQASHVDPNYRDGWNACYRAALASQPAQADVSLINEGNKPAQPAPVAVDEREPHCTICGVTLHEPHHPQCSAVKAAVIGINNMASNEDAGRRRELADKIKGTLVTALQSARSGQGGGDAVQDKTRSQRMREAGFTARESLFGAGMLKPRFRDGGDGGDAGGELGTLTITSTPSGTRMLSTSFDWQGLPDGTHKLYTTHPAAVSAEGVKRLGNRWRVVPADPTTSMLVAGNHCQPGDYSARLVWEKMLEAAERSVSYLAPLPQDVLAAAPAAPVQAGQGVGEDTKRLDALRDNSWDLRCFDMPTGAGDADIGWRVIQHHMAKPHERTVGEAFEDDPRKAIDAAMAASKEGQSHG